MEKYKNNAQALDPLRTLFVAYAPRDVREDLYQLIIVNAEFSSILEKAREPMQALARLQFWQIQLEKIHRGEQIDTAHAGYLKQLVDKYDLDMSILQQWLLIRQKEYEHLPHKNLDDFDHYLRQTAGNFMILWDSIICKNKQQHNDKQQLQAIGHLWGAVGILRSIAFHGHLHLCHLPQDLLYDHGLLLTDSWYPAPKDNLSTVVEKIIAHSIMKLKWLQQQDLSALDKSIHLHLIAASQLLKHMESLKFDPFHLRWTQIPKSVYFKVLIKGLI